MTGEITLRGRVLPVGGVREKVLAAYRAGIKTVIIPEKNVKDLVDVPKKALHDLKIIPVNHMDQVIEIAISPQSVIEPPRPKKRPGIDDMGEVEVEILEEE
jgi:ATP-dependent Lon protease